MHRYYSYFKLIIHKSTNHLLKRYITSKGIVSHNLVVKGNSSIKHEVLELATYMSLCMEVSMHVIIFEALIYLPCSE